MNDLNIIIINDHASVTGGEAQVAIGSAVGLAQRGVPVIYFSAVKPVAPALKENGVEVICLGQHDIASNPDRIKAVLGGIWNRDAAREMEAILRRSSPQDTIIHVHGWTKALSSSVLRAAIRRGYRVVITLHAYFVACPNGGFFNYQHNTICQLKALSPACVFENCDKQSYAHKVWRVLRQFIQRRLGKIPGKISHFITLSDLSEQVLAPYLPPGAIRYRLQNPIRAEQRPPVQVASNTQFGYIGRLSPEKGVDLFARAVLELAVDAVCIGGGPEKDRLERAYPSLYYPGWLASDQLDQSKSQIRCLVFPSVCYETAGMVVQEAQALGVPAIVSDQTAAVDFIEDGITGLLYKSGNLGDLKKKIKRCQQDNDLVARMGREAYRRFWADPPIVDAHLEGLLEIYGRILSQERDKP